MSRSALLLAHAAAAVLVAPAVAPAPASTLRTAIGEPATLDPAKARTAYDYAVVSRVYSRLVESDAALDLRPALARTWTVSEDGRTYTFRLAPARFHNGRAVEAADVAGTLQRLLAPGASGPYAELLSVVEGARAFSQGQAPTLSGVRVLGPREVEVRLEEPYSSFLSLLTAPSLSIVPAEEAARAGAAFGHAPIGSGPFRFERWEPGQRIVLVAHDGAPEGRPAADGLTFVLLPQSAAVPARVRELVTSRAVDYVLVPPGPAEPVPGFEIRSHRELAVFFIGFNTSSGPGADARLRRAFRLGLDRSEFARRMLIDGSLLTDSIIPDGFPRMPRAVPAPEFEEARRLFKELAADGRKPRLRLDYTAGRQEIQDAFVALAEHFGTLGLEVVLNRRPNLNDLMALTEQGRSEAWFGGMQADYPNPDGLLRTMFRSRTQGANWFRYRSAAMDDVLDDCRRTADPRERIRLFAALDDLVAKDVPAVPLWGRTYRYYVGDHVQGLELSYFPFHFPLSRVSLLSRPR
ncbi:MAG TPA: ABC transporter substrate-binding protein [Vicinamibacteria bacterium]|nr:ABC transporter substrate-binding protein [Vicinamibacteria bacterium]